MKSESNPLVGRTLARRLSRELSHEELAQVSGGGPVLRDLTGTSVATCCPGEDDCGQD